MRELGSHSHDKEHVYAIHDPYQDHSDRCLGKRILQVLVPDWNCPFSRLLLLVHKVRSTVHNLFAFAGVQQHALLFRQRSWPFDHSLANLRDLGHVERLPQDREQRCENGAPVSSAQQSNDSAGVCCRRFNHDACPCLRERSLDLRVRIRWQASELLVRQYSGGSASAQSTLHRSPRDVRVLVVGGIAVPSSPRQLPLCLCRRVFGSAGGLVCSAGHAVRLGFPSYQRQS